MEFIGSLIIVGYLIVALYTSIKYHSTTGPEQSALRPAIDIISLVGWQQGKQKLLSDYMRITLLARHFVKLWLAARVL